MNYKKYFLISLIIALVISALVGIYIFLFGKGNVIEGKVLFTTLAVASFSLLAFCSALQQNKAGFRWFSLAGVLVSVVAFGLVLIFIWMEEKDGTDFWKVASIATIIAFAFAHASLIFLIKVKSLLTRFAMISTIVFIVFVTIMLFYAIIYEVQSEFYFRLLGVFAILDVLGSITTPLLSRLTGQK